MGMIEIFEKLGLMLGLSAIFAISVVFVLRKILELMINRDIEKFKSELERESASHKIRYEYLHEERMLVIKNTYQKLSKTYKLVDVVMHLFWSDSTDNAKMEEDVSNKIKIETIIRVAASVNELKDYFEENRIFLDEEMANQIDSVIKDLSKLWNEDLLLGDIRYCSSKNSLNVWNDEWEHLKVKIPKIKSQLEVKFRSIIGIDL